MLSVGFPGYCSLSWSPVVFVDLGIVLDFRLKVLNVHRRCLLILRRSYTVDRTWQSGYYY